MADEQRSEAELEREIRQGRNFTPEEALARMAGPGAMKGASPVSQVQQAETEIGNWLKRNIADPAGILPAILQTQLRGSVLLLDNLDQPLTALAKHLDRLLNSDAALQEFVRQADVEWGQRMDERPYFAREGQSDHPDDPYTLASVMRALRRAAEHLAGRTK
jgi:hypothetical protein